MKKRTYRESVDRFVAYLNARGLGPQCASDVPEELRLGANPRDETMFGWYILKSEANPWVAPLIEKLPRPYSSRVLKKSIHELAAV